MDVLERVFDEAARELVPLSVHVDLTYRCHQRCLHCYLPEAWRRGEGPGPELSTDQVKGILDQLAAAGTFFLTFSGGEISLRPDLFAILEYARGLNFSISLMSSGSRGWEEEQIRVLADLGVEAMLLSLHGLEARWHDRLTGLPGSWRQVRQTIERCRSHGLLVGLNSQILGLNLRGVPGLQSWAADQGLPLRVNDDLSPRWDGRPHPAALFLQEEEKAWLRREVKVGEHCPPGEETSSLLAEEVGVCRAGRSFAYLTPWGMVWPCMDLRFPCGFLGRGGSFARIWREAGPLKRLRQLRAQDRDRLKPFCPALGGFADGGLNCAD